MGVSTQARAGSERLARAGRPGPPDQRPLFDEGSWIRRVAGEPVVFLGGGRALLLEIAHPLVAAGVAGHSEFRRDPFGRLRRTLDALNRIVFGSRADAVTAAQQVEAVHARVRGELGEAGGRFPAGTAYSGRDPRLVRWVWATLVDTALVVYERFAAELPPEGREAFYTDHRVVGLLFGVEAADMPPDWSAFREWFDATLAGDELEVTPLAREIGDAVFATTDRMPQGRLLRNMTAALLPETLRRAFGLEWDRDRAAALEEWTRNVRRLRRA